MKRIVAAALIIVLTLISSTPIVLADGNQYAIRDDSYVALDPQYATREEAVAQFVKAIGSENLLPDPQILAEFSDAGKVAAVYAPAVSAAVSAGLLNGYEDGTLRPQEPISRTEAFVLLNRALVDQQLPKHSSVTFIDTPEWAYEDIERLSRAGIVQGYGNGKLGAGDYITREQVSLLVNRIYRITGPMGDFYDYVNREWLEDTQIPAGLPAWSDTDALTQLLSRQVSEIIYGLYKDKYKKHKSFQQNSNEQKIVDVYAAVVDQSYRDELGFEPIAPYLKQIDEVKTTPQLVKVMAELENSGFHNLLPLMLDVDVRDSAKTALVFSGCYTGIHPSLIQAGDYQKHMQDYELYLTTLLMQAGEEEEEAKRHGAAAARLCEELAKAALPDTDEQKLQETCLMYTKTEFRKLMPKLGTDAYLKELGFENVKSIGIYDTELAKAINQLLVPEQLENLKSYLKAAVVDAASMYLNTEAFEAYQTFQNQLTGTQANNLPGDYAVSIVQTLLGWEIAEQYVQRYCSEEAQKYVEDMTNTILAAYKKRLEGNLWMSSQTREATIKKLDVMGINIGYPQGLDHFTNPAFQVRSIQQGGNLVEYMVTYNRAYAEYCAQVVDREIPPENDGWGILPQTANAMYDPAANTITIPAGILQPPFFDPEASREANLGGIGAVIAHEISHAFDTTGAQFDQNGNLADWWSKQDYEAFQEICSKVVEAYDEIEVLPGNFVNGKKTLGENLADLAGMACVLDVAGADNPNLDKLFTSYAKTWRMKSTEAYSKMLLKVDNHAPDKVRVNRVLANFDAFLNYYEVQEEDGMYLPPSQRLQIWRRRPGN